MDEPELDYHAITLDTCIFDEYADALHTGLLKQLEQFNESPVDVLLTDVVIHELENHLLRRVANARQAVKDAVRAIEAAEKELTPGDNFQKARKLLTSENSDLDFVKERIDAFYSAVDITVVKSERASAKEVSEGFVKTLPPFGYKEEKKHEFPDAFALSSLENYAKEKDIKILVVSKDKGWRKYCEKSGRLVCVPDLGAAFDMFQAHTGTARLIDELSQSIMQLHMNTILEAVEEGLKESVESEEVEVNADSAYYYDNEYATATYKGHEFEVAQYGKKEPTINLIRVQGNEAIIQLRAVVTSVVEFSYTLNTWDSTDHEYIPVSSQDSITQHKYETDVLVTLTGDYSKGIAGVTVENVEVTDNPGVVEFGELEIDFSDGRDAEERDRYEESQRQNVKDEYGTFDT